MQQEATSVTNKSKEEQAEVEEELARMAKLVFTFQVYKQYALMLFQYIQKGCNTHSKTPA